MACAVDVSAARVVLQPAPARGNLAGKMQTTGAAGLANWPGSSTGSSAQVATPLRTPPWKLFYTVEMGGSGSDDRLCVEAYPGNPSPWTFWQHWSTSDPDGRFLEDGPTLDDPGIWLMKQ